jgi:ABC-2 type transport system ATP-binding protein
MIGCDNMRATIEIKDLYKSYGKTHALKGVSLKIEPGIFGLLGPNGAGKTTLLKILLGLIKPDRGEAKIFGYDCFSQSLEIRKHLGYLGEDQRYYEYMRGQEYLEFIGLIKGLTKEEAKLQVKEILDMVKLSEYGGKKIKEYSQGMKQRLGLAQALIGKPKLIVLDEPTSNLDPIGRYDFLKIIKEIGKNGVTIILSSHILGEVEQVCDSLVFLNQGKIVYQGKWLELKKKFPKKSLQDIFIEIITGEKNEKDFTDS